MNDSQDWMAAAVPGGDSIDEANSSLLILLGVSLP